MAISLRQMLVNHTRGISTNVKVYKGEYFDQEVPRVNDLTDFDKLRQDLSDLDQVTADQITEDLKPKEDPKDPTPPSTEEGRGEALILS